MDNLCHTLAGAALGEAGLKRRVAYGSATLMLASNLPDIDVAVFLTDTLAMSFRRGWTHGLLAQIFLPPALAALVWLWGRRSTNRGRRSGSWGGWSQSTSDPAHVVVATSDPGVSTSDPAAGGRRSEFRALVALCYVGVWLHIFMDWLNSYGIRLLKPFSDRWFYGDALYIVDPILYVIFGTAVVLARRAQRRSQPAPWRYARVGLMVAATYIAVMLISNSWARAEVRAELQRAGYGERRFMVTPVFLNPLRREVFVDLGHRYEKGELWFEPSPRFRPLGYGVDTNLLHPAALQAAQTPRFQAFLMWSRFPFFVVEQRGDRTVVVINDYRYSGASGRDGWATQTLELGPTPEHPR